jgi:hypothetical protein
MIKYFSVPVDSHKEFQALQLWLFDLGYQWMGIGKQLQDKSPGKTFIIDINIDKQHPSRRYFTYRRGSKIYDIYLCPNSHIIPIYNVQIPQKYLEQV